MRHETGVLILDATEAQKRIADCEIAGWSTYRLPAGISSKAELFEGIRRTLPLDPMLQSNESWDALADSLWAGLDSLPAKKIALLWPDASIIQSRAPSDFAVATDLFADLASSLADARVMQGQTRQLFVAIGI